MLVSRRPQPVGSLKGDFVEQIDAVVLFGIAVIETMLVVRFALNVTRADPGSPLVAAIYDLTDPLVAPFLGVTLLAIAVYAISGWLVAKTLGLLFTR